MDIEKSHDKYLEAQIKRREWNERVSNALADIEDAAYSLNYRQMTVSEAGRRIGLLAAQLEELARDEPPKS